MRWATVDGEVKKALRDLFGGEAADLAQRQRDLRVRRQRRMAAGEDQPQPVVLHALLVVSAGVARGGLEAFGDLAERGVEPRALAHGGDRS